MNMNNVFLPYGEQALYPTIQGNTVGSPTSKKVKGSYKQRLWAKVHGAVKANSVKWWV